MTTIRIEIVAQSNRQIVARLTRPAGYTLPSTAVEGLLRSEIASALDTTPKDLKWYAVQSSKVVSATEITMSFEPSIIRTHEDGTMSVSLDRLRRR